MKINAAVTRFLSEVGSRGWWPGNSPSIHQNQMVGRD